MNTIHISIYEDDEIVAHSLADRIKKAYSEGEVHVADKEEVKSLFDVVHERRRKWREDDSDADIGNHEVDKADVVVLDCDLFGYWESCAVDTTGSRLAYLMRCFTKCGFIVLLNQYGTNVFDFSLGSPSDGFADLHIGGEQIGNTGLWNPAPFTGYRPWHWPVIPYARKRFEECVAEVEEYLDGNEREPLIEFLDLHRVIDWIPIQAREFLTGGKKRLGDVTLQDFVFSSHRGVEAKDRLPRRQIARVSAARISALLNNIILPEQNALVDAPHLVSRFGSVFQNSGGEIEDWNKLCDPVDAQIDCLLEGILPDYRFPKRHWLWRPAWFWPEASLDERVREVLNPWSSTGLLSDRVFCEDVSKFVRTEHALSFRASVSPPFIKRYVCNKDSEEARRSVGDAVDEGSVSLTQVKYVPQAAFSR